MTHLDRPEYLGLLAAVLADPEDDAPRLVLADWLDERPEDGARLYAEFIRVQCKLAGLLQEREELGTDTVYDDNGRAVVELGPAIEALQGRELELLQANAEEWVGVGPLPDLPDWADRLGWQPPRMADAQNGGYVGYRVEGAEVQYGLGYRTRLVFRRGFVERLTMAADDLCHLDAVLLRQPVRHVTLTTTPRASGARLNDGRWKVWLEEAPGKAVVAASLPPVSRTVEWLLDQLFPGIAFTPPSRTGPVMGRNPTLSVRQADGTWQQVFPGGER